MTEENKAVSEETLSSDDEEDDNPIKKTFSRKKFVMTPAREETLRRGREKRRENVKRLQKLKQEEKDKAEQLRQKARQKTPPPQSFRISFL